MDLNYLVNNVLPTRKKEIENGDNLATRQPIYIVLELKENYHTEHQDDYVPVTNYKNKEYEYGYFDTAIDSEDIEFNLSPKKMKRPTAVTRFYTDQYVAFFFTSEAAHEYLKYQSHNLNNPYVYVFYSGYGNRQMDALLNNE